MSFFFVGASAFLSAFEYLKAQTLTKNDKAQALRAGTRKNAGKV
jgi:hypothetical protein